MEGHPMIPAQFRNSYPNAVQEVAGTPAVVFRDHRWTLPVLHFAAENRLLRLPARVVTFDRHRDSLVPVDLANLARRRSGVELVGAVAAELSPRDDDWIIGGMELGLISDVVRFGTEQDGMEQITSYRDGSGGVHRIFHLERPAVELSWKGALVNDTHPAAKDGLWEALGWNPAGMTVAKADDLALDLDLDFFTISWENYTLPFPEEVYRGEFLSSCQSVYSNDYRPVEFLDMLLKASGTLTIACEPDFCGGEAKAHGILEDVNRLLLGGELNMEGIRVDYPPVYPVE